MDTRRALQISSLLAQSSQQFVPVGSPQAQTAAALEGSAQSGIEAENIKAAQKQQEKKQKSGMFGSIGGALGSVAGIGLAPLTGGTSLAIPAAMGAGGGMFGSAVGQAAGGGGVNPMQVGMAGFSGGVGGAAAGMGGIMGAGAPKAMMGADLGEVAPLSAGQTFMHALPIAAMSGLMPGQMLQSQMPRPSTQPTMQPMTQPSQISRSPYVPYTPQQWDGLSAENGIVTPPGAVVRVGETQPETAVALPGGGMQVIPQDPAAMQPTMANAAGAALQQFGGMMAQPQASTLPSIPGSHVIGLRPEQTMQLMGMVQHNNQQILQHHEHVQDTLAVQQQHEKTMQQQIKIEQMREKNEKDMQQLSEQGRMNAEKFEAQQLQVTARGVYDPATKGFTPFPSSQEEIDAKNSLTKERNAQAEAAKVRAQSTTDLTPSRIRRNESAADLSDAGIPVKDALVGKYGEDAKLAAEKAEYTRKMTEKIDADIANAQRRLENASTRQERTSTHAFVEAANNFGKIVSWGYPNTSNAYINAKRDMDEAKKEMEGVPAPVAPQAVQPAAPSSFPAGAGSQPLPQPAAPPQQPPGGVVKVVRDANGNLVIQ